MNVILPNMTAPEAFMRSTVTLHVDDRGLSKIATTCLSDQRLQMRVRPSGYEDAPHLVKLTVAAEFEAAMRVIAQLNIDLNQARIK